MAQGLLGSVPWRSTTPRRMARVSSISLEGGRMAGVVTVREGTTGASVAMVSGVQRLLGVKVSLRTTVSG